MTQKTNFNIHLVGHAHLDLVYRWRWSETIHYAAKATFERVLAAMEEAPELVFVQSQMALYAAVQAHDPELFQKIKARIQTGQWIVVGGMWTEPDLNLLSGESIARQILIGKQYLRTELGADTTVAWLPDVFGHNANLPAILAHAGMTFYVAGRCLPPDLPCFWWESRDGSRILVYHFPENYSGEITPELPERLAKWVITNPIREVLYLFGEGDHGGGPRPADLKHWQQLKASLAPGQIHFTPPAQYFEQLLATAPDLPIVRGELNFFARGAYTTQARVKWMNRQAENLLITAEKFAAPARFIHRKPAGQRHELLQAWKNLLWLQFHDNLPGTSIGPVYADNALVFDEIQRLGNQVLEEALTIIHARLNTLGEGQPVVVFNPQGEPRGDLVTVTIRLREVPKYLQVSDETAVPTPAQILSVRQDDFDGILADIIFRAEQVPACGYRLFRIFPTTEALAMPPDLQIDSTRLENEYLRVTVNPATGQISQIYDKIRQSSLLTAAAGLQIIPEQPLNTAWTIRLSDAIHLPVLKKIQIREQGPVRIQLEITSHWQDSDFRVILELAAAQPWLTYHLEVNWQERDTCLKVAFPLQISSPMATFEIPYGSIERPTDGNETPTLRWVDLADTSGGAALLNNGKYGVDVTPGQIRMTILRGANDMDPQADLGRHTTSLAFLPHAGDWRQGRVLQQAEAFNQPLLGRVATKHVGSQAGWGVPPENPLPASLSFLTVEPEGVVLAAFKMAEAAFGPAEIIVRIFESYGEPVTARLIFPVIIEAAWECNLLEEPQTSNACQVVGNEVHLPIGAYAIKTIAVKYAARIMGALPGGWQGMEQDA